MVAAEVIVAGGMTVVLSCTRSIKDYTT